MAGIFEFNSAQRTYARRLLISNVQKDYQPLLVEVLPIPEVAAPANAGRPFDVGFPASWSELAVVQGGLLWAAMQYQFWYLDSEGRYARFARDGKSGAVLLTEALVSVAGPDGDFTAARMSDFQQALTLFPAASSRVAILEEQLTPVRGQAALAGALLESIKAQGHICVAQARMLAFLLSDSYGDRYLKKAQLALSAIAGALTLRGTPVDTADLTVFADYQVPKVMHALGLLRYSPEVEDLVRRQQRIPSGSPAERALRSACVLAGEELAKAMQASPAEVDAYLWTQRDKLAQALPHHLTETTEY